MPSPGTGLQPAKIKLGFVEFDDMGEFWESCSSLAAGTECQLSRVLALIREEKGAPCSTDSCMHDVVVVVFVHGWKNNASPFNETHKNLLAFKKLLAELVAGEKLTANAQARPPRTYIGIYIAWRGQVLAGDVFATFWNRRDAAARIAGPAFSEAIYRIISATKQDSPNSKVVVVGHSFGARVLENAISDVFVSLVLPNPNLGGSAQTANPISPADLIVYVNSANNSFHAKAMIELLKRSSVEVGRRPGAPAGPLFLSVTSVGDLATKIAFPIGQDFSSLTKAFRHYDDSSGPLTASQRKYFKKTPGHVPRLLSHEVVKSSLRKIDCTSIDDKVRFYVANECYELHTRSVRWNDSPYWITTVPKAIIPDHSQIFTDAFVEMLTEVIVHYDVVDTANPTRMLVRR